MLKGRVIKHLIVPAAALAAALLTVGSAQADTITVTLGWDRFDPGAASGCSLREAIQAANTNSTVAGCTHTGSDINDLIVFDGAVSAVSITRTVSTDNDDNDDGDLDAFVGAVSGTLTVRGPISVQVDANLFDRAFDVFADGSTGNQFALERVTVSGGDVRLDVTPESYTDKFLCTFSGGALRVGSGVSALLDRSVIATNTAAIAGGGICALPDASLTLTGTTIQSNTAGLSGTTPVDYAWGGGGIWSNGALVMTNSQVLNNRAVLSGSNGHLIGGGGIAVVTGAVSIKDSTISLNLVEQFGSGIYDEGNGGGLLVHRLTASAPVVLDNVRVERNQSLNARTAYGGGVALLQGVQATIINQTVITGNVVSATQGAFGGGLALGLSYQPNGYLASSLDANNAQFERNRATASIASTPGVITPTVMGGGAFIGERATFAITQAVVADNLIHYLGSSTINTIGLGGGAEARGSGQIVSSQVLRNQAQAFSYVGGAGLRAGGSLVLRSSLVEANTAASVGGGLGGGVLVDGLAHVENVTAQNNAISGPTFADGGGIGTNGQLFLTHTVVASNTALQGGGIAVGAAGLLQARFITLTHNQAVGTNFAQGGGLFGGGTAVVDQALIAHNRAQAPNFAAGGGVHRYGGTTHIRNSTIRDNLAVSANGGAKGGGWTSAGEAFVTDTLIASNVVSAGNFAAGGGIAQTGGSFVLLNSEVTTNTARAQNSNARGGAVVLEIGTLMNVSQARVASNVARSANGAVYGGGFDVGSGATLRLTATLVLSNAAVGNNNSGSGGIGNIGTVEIHTSTVRQNAVLSVTTMQLVGGGGGIGNGGTMHIRASSVVSNRAGTGAGLNAFGGQTHVLNSTFSSNEAASTNDIGGLILTGTVRITHTTVASNTGQGIAIQGNGLVLRAVAVANNAGGNCANWGGSVANSDYSVSSDATCATFFLGANTLNNTPHTRLALLTFHPGTATWYHPTLVGSALHERVPAGDCVARDQLGQPRPGGSLPSAPNCDTGAFEFQNLYLTYVPIVRKQP